MTTQLDTEMAAVVTELLIELGIDAILVSESIIYNATLEIGTPVETLTTIRCSPPGDYRRFMGMDLGSGTSELQIVTRTLEPKIGDRVEVIDKKFRVTKIWSLYSGDNVAAWVVFLEGKQ